MKKVKTLIIKNTLLFLSALTVFFSAFAMEFSPRGAGSSEFLNLTRHEWSDIHTYSGYVFGILIIIHLAMHINWIKSIRKLWKNAK